MASAIGTAGDARCPKCDKKLEWVGSGPGYLNSEQWDAIKAGEYFTTCADAQCGGRRHLSNGNVYFGEIEPPKAQTRAELESEIAALRRRVAQLERERDLISSMDDAAMDKMQAMMAELAKQRDAALELAALSLSGETP